MSKHTPGPWWLDEEGFITKGEKETFKIIADSHCSSDIDINIDEREANANLIAAAPELLDTLEMMVKAFEEPRSIDPLVAFAAIERAKFIISKAKGR